MTESRNAVAFQRGDILWIQCGPSIGVEPQKIRTCVVAQPCGRVVLMTERQIVSWAQKSGCASSIVNLGGTRHCEEP